MGALSAAARLATGGHRVAVYERSATHGGGVGRYERDGFRFDTGPGLLHLPAVYRDLFIKTGRKTLEQSVELVRVDPSARHVFTDGTAVTLPDASQAGVVAALDEAFGAGAGERWSELLTSARVAWEATRRPLLEDVLAADPAPLARDPYPARPVRRGLFRRAAPTLAETAARELVDPRLAALLEQYAWAYGHDPRTAPSSAAVLPYMEHTFGTWYVRGGGLRALAEAVYERCLERGVQFRFGAEVIRVVDKDGRAAGVELADGTVAEADSVVSGAPPRILGPAPGSLSRFTVLLALRGARTADAVHRTVVHGDQPVTVLRPDDPALVPDSGHEAVTLTVTVPPQGGSVDWTAEGVAEEHADRLIAAVEAAVPGLGGRTLWRVVRTPADMERDTGAPGGAVPGPGLAGADGAFLRHHNRGALPGLYHVGGHAHPGGGLAHTGMSGAIVADLISGGPGGSR